jgi:hypothetical protein
MIDRIFASFLEAQHEEAAALAAASDILELDAIDAQHLLARFHCRGLVRDGSGAIRDADRFEVGIWLPGDYLRRVEPALVLTLLAPRNVFHPNVRGPFLCIGPVAPGTPVVDVIYRVYELLSWQSVTVDERDALDPEACQLARNHPERFPLDRRPLKRRRVDAPEARA